MGKGVGLLTFLSLCLFGAKKSLGQSRARRLESVWQNSSHARKLFDISSVF